MNLKITGRFILTVALVTIIVIIINMGVGMTYMVSRVISINRTGEMSYFSPENFTEEFNKYLMGDKDEIYVNEDGKKILKKQKAWIQVLDEDGSEVYSYAKPIRVKEHYSPIELVHAYKYSLAETDSTIFVGGKNISNRNYSYIIGFSLKKVGKIVFAYENYKIANAIKSVIVTVLLISIPIALLFGYLFSRRLTKPLVSVVEDVQTLSEGEYNLQREEKGVYKQIYGSINNLSLKLKSNEEERKKIEKMREEWISNISHDIKTPLVSIKGYAEILSNEEYNFTKAEIREYSKIIENKSDYIKELIDDLNLSTRLKNKTLLLNLKNINIVSLVRGVVIDILNDPKTSNSNIEFSAPIEVIEKDIDEILIKRVIINFLYNSIVHNDESIDIKIEVEKRDKIHIYIIDNGKGIKEEELKHIFERYYRGTNTGTKHKGSGLGMAIAHDIIQAHGGTINIKSQIGVGTEIEIIL